MDLILDLIVSLSRWCRGHLSDIALAIVATVLVLIAPHFNGWLRRSSSGLNFVLRTLLFILVCALGYGLALVLLTPWLAKGLGQLNNFTLAPVLLLGFVLIGVIYERS